MNPWNLPEVIRADLDGNGKVEMEDVNSLVWSFGSCPGDAKWKFSADLTRPMYLIRDGKIDMRDLGLASRYLGETH